MSQYKTLTITRALQSFIIVVGARDVGEYMRDDSKLFLRHLEMSDDKMTKIRKHINRFSAVLNCAYADLDFDKLNPFSRLIIKSGGEDYHRRGIFTN